MSNQNKSMIQLSISRLPLSRLLVVQFYCIYLIGYNEQSSQFSKVLVLFFHPTTVFISFDWVYRKEELRVTHKVTIIS